MRVHPCLFCRRWIGEDDMIPHILDNHLEEE
jgi:hypothetical protein